METLEVQYNDVFIATPTHTCKRYCATKYLEAIFSAFKVQDVAPRSLTTKENIYHSPVIAIANNARGSAATYYNAVTLRHQKVVRFFYFDLTLPDDFYGRADSIHRRIVYSMNYLRDRFLETDCKYFLSLEADVLINKHTLEGLLQHIQLYPVVHSNCYPGFHTQNFPCLVQRMTLGCTMISREVVEKIPFRYDVNLLACHHDGHFAFDTIQKGYEIFYDPYLKVDHVHNTLGSRGWEQLPMSER